MHQNFDPSFQLLIKTEGGFSNDPQDPGGVTNLGVTLASWSAYVNRSVSVEEMHDLTPAIVSPFYRSQYWNPIQGDALPLGLDYAVFDFAVNSGVRRAAMKLQALLGTAPDGAVGPATLAAAQMANLSNLISQYQAARLVYLQSLPGWAHDGGGWGPRVERVKSQALAMAGISAV